MNQRPSALHPGGWVAIPVVMLEDDRILPTARSVYAAIASWLTDSKTYVSYREIRARSGVKDKRTIHPAIETLAEYGYVNVIRHNGNPFGHRYSLPGTPPHLLPGTHDVPGPGTSNVPGTRDVPGTGNAGEGGHEMRPDPPHSVSPLNREIDRGSSSHDITPEQWEAAERALSAREALGYSAHSNRAALLRKMAREDYRPDGSPTSDAKLATHTSGPPEPATDPEVESCEHCDHRGLRLEPWATPDDPAPIVPTIRCDHSVASLEETS